MPSDETRSAADAARTAWTDLLAIAAAHRWLAVAAVIACTAASLANAAVNPNDELTSLAIMRALGLAVAQTFLITPVLIASHRFVILGEIAQDYASAWFTRRFWRFFLLSAALVAGLYLPMLFTQWRLLADRGLAILVFAIALLVVFLGSLWLSLLFPAIATDAPGTSARNAAADLRGNAWAIFWAGTAAVLPLALLSTIVGIIEIALGGAADVRVRMALAPLEGANVAAFYVLLVVVASRFYLAVGNRLKQPA
jgi:hypothetical protein